MTNILIAFDDIIINPNQIMLSPNTSIKQMMGKLKLDKLMSQQNIITNSDVSKALPCLKKRV